MCAAGLKMGACARLLSSLFLASLLGWAFHKPLELWFRRISKTPVLEKMNSRIGTCTVCCKFCFLIYCLVCNWCTHVHSTGFCSGFLSWRKLNWQGPGTGPSLWQHHCFGTLSPGGQGGSTWLQRWPSVKDWPFSAVFYSLLPPLIIIKVF